MFKKILLISAVSVAFSSMAWAVDSTGTTTPTTTSPTTTTTTTTPTATTPTTTAPTSTKPTTPSSSLVVEKPHGNNITAPVACKSGSRTVGYDYDSKTGALSANVTFDKCLLANGVSITGVSSVEGTLLAAGDLSYTIDLTDQVDTTITGKTGLPHTRKCTIVTKGTLDAKKQAFSGSIQRNNCELNGYFRANRDFLENLLKRNTSTEEPDTDD